MEINISVPVAVLQAILNMPSEEATIELLSNTHGYQAKIKNEDYVPSVGSAVIDDPDWVMPDDFNPEEDEIPTIPNTETYTEAVGEPTIDNPQSRLNFVGKKVGEFASIDMVTPIMAARKKEIDEAQKVGVKAVVDAVVVNE